MQPCCAACAEGGQEHVITDAAGRPWRFEMHRFCGPMVRRSLSINFDKECGPEKGSWKGGLMGTGIAMLPGELHEAAFRRYCDQEHSAKYSRYRITFVGAA